MVPDFDGFDDLGHEILHRLGPRLPVDLVDSLSEFIDVGEEGLFADWLAGVLADGRTVIDREERDLMVRILGYFPPADPTGAFESYPHLADAERTIAAFTVVDEP